MRAKEFFDGLIDLKLTGMKLLQQLRFCKQETKKIAPQNAHYCRTHNTPMQSVILDAATSLGYITTQRYTQIVTSRYSRRVYLVFVFTMLIHSDYYVNKWNNIAEKSYVSRIRQNGREIRIPCSQKCPNPSREIQIQTLKPIFRTACITHLLHLSIDFLQAMLLDFAYNPQLSLT